MPYISQCESNIYNFDQSHFISFVFCENHTLSELVFAVFYCLIAIYFTTHPLFFLRKVLLHFIQYTIYVYKYAISK